MKIYLDTCSIQRPLDSRTQIRIVLEAEAVLGVLALYESGEIELVSSEALAFEINRNPIIARRDFGLAVLSQTKIFIVLNEHVENRARELNKGGIKPLDALHLASAEAGQADYFCTCDDRLLKQAKALSGLKTRVVSPVELIGELER